MERQIKFRGLRLDGKGWVYGCPAYGLTQKVEFIMPKMYFATRDFGEIDDDDNPIIEDEMAIGGFIPVKPETVGQFTGLFANNRKNNLEKEVWELDVFREQKETNVGDEVEYLVVMWIKQRAAFYLIPAAHYNVISNDDVSKEKEFEWLFSDAALYDFSIDIGLTKVGNIIDNPELLTK